MSVFPASKQKLQKQLKRLFWGLVIITGVNGYLFWSLLQKTFNAQEDVARSQYVISMVSDLERAFVEENKLKDSNRESPGGRQLAEVKKRIRSNLKSLQSYETDKKQSQILKDISFLWQRARSNQDYFQLHLLTDSFVQARKIQMAPSEKILRDGAQQTGRMFGLYVGFFALTILILNMYFGRRIFTPLNRLSKRMQDFQAGQTTLAPFSGSNDEIGHLESQFYEMAGRVTDTVDDLKELDRVKTDFISIVSHELRTPMTSVKGSLSLILSGSLCEVPPEVREVLTIAEKETDRLIRLINDILDLTKMEAKKMPMAKKWVPVHGIVQNAVAGLSGLFDAANVKVAIEAPAENLQANCDQDRIQQVITNLISNAVKFSPAGSLVTVEFERAQNGVIIRIRDQGPGIRVEDQPKVFEKFTSVESGKSRLIRGTGLGLPICKAIVEQHGGMIGLESQVGVGSVFYFTLPEVQVTPNHLGYEGAA